MTPRRCDRDDDFARHLAGPSVGGRVRLIVVVRTMCTIAVTTMIGCASGIQFFSMGPRPQEIAGVWIDSSHVTPQDTLAWVLSSDGQDRTLHITVADSAGLVTTRQRQVRHGSWFLSGALGDTARRAICFKQRPRDGGTCVRFHIDTLTGGGAPPRRRLVISGYPGQHQTRDRVLLERLP